MNHCYVLIMAGGSGTRLWPISRRSRPKQFQAFTSEQTLLQHMVELCQQIVPTEQIYVMATPEFGSVITQQIPTLPEENLLYEPARRDNGPAITLGMLQIHQRDPQATVAIVWSDHLIQEPAVFSHVLNTAFQASLEHPESLVTVGAKPTSPDTGLGYIQMGKEIAQHNHIPVFKVKKFIEKPDLETATRFVKSWEYLWNVGYKIMNTASYIAAFNRVQPELVPIIEKLSQAIKDNNRSEIKAHYQSLPALSIEHLFTPFLTDLLVVPGDIGWSDIGNWNILHEILKTQDNHHFVSRGKVINIDSQNSLVFSKNRPIVTVGVEDLIIVDEGDTILVMAKSAAQHIKKVTQTLEESNQELL